jgi:TetR/AcrR family transcriptional repressor of mexJK operon
MVMHANLARPGRDERRRAILDVALELFMQEGYAAASMSVIAARVGGSKGTLYNYFPSKETLFAALMEAECESEAWVTATLESASDSVDGALLDIGGRFLDFALSGKVMNIHRLVIAESGRFPELGRTFFDSGPKRSIERVSGWLAERIAQGELVGDDPEHMATLFMDMCKSGLHQKLLWNVDTPPARAKKAANVAAAVKVFMAAYGASGPRRGEAD